MMKKIEVLQQYLLGTKYWGHLMEAAAIGLNAKVDGITIKTIVDRFEEDQENKNISLNSNTLFSTKKQ